MEPAPRRRGRLSTVLLTVDVGNTHIRFGLYGRGDGTVEGHTVEGSPTGAGDDGPRATYSVRTSPAVTADELALTIRGLLGDDATRALEGAMKSFKQQFSPSDGAAMVPADEQHEALAAEDVDQEKIVRQR